MNELHLAAILKALNVVYPVGHKKEELINQTLYNLDKAEQRCVLAAAIVEARDAGLVTERFTATRNPYYVITARGKTVLAEELS